MNISEVRANADYQRFRLEDDGRLADVGERMSAKLDAFGELIPDLRDKTVLDVGTDFGFWAFFASQQGASEVLGLDRNRSVRGLGEVDLIELNTHTAEHYPAHQRCRFARLELGRQWHEFGKWDVVFCMSMYHHAYELCGSHESVWLWLWRHTSDTLIWEGPLDPDDPVVGFNVSPENQKDYNAERITEAASKYFDIVKVMPSGHERTRVAWKCTPKRMPHVTLLGSAVNGAGGASKAFLHKNGRRIEEFSTIFGVTPVPGSLNVMLSAQFDWGSGFYRAQIADVVRRGQGLDVLWMPKTARVYPVWCNGTRALAFRFESDGYPGNFIELVSEHRLRDRIGADNRVEIST